MLSNSSFTDQLGRTIYLPAIPQRIVSVVPSQTELLFDLGLKDRLVGITKFCIHPAASVADVTKIGGTKQLDIDLIKTLQPDLIIANKEENDRSQIEALMQQYPVWVSDIDNLQSALEMISSVGELTGKATEATALARSIFESFASLHALTNQLSVAYLIWRKPYMLAGKGTFIDDMLTRCGFRNAASTNRYPEIAIENLVKLNPDVVLLSSEPYPFKQKHIDELRAYIPQSQIYLVDGELFSWYGSRLQYSSAYLQQLIKRIVNEA